jgi:DNA-binding MarR family transcriptional regulator
MGADEDVMDLVISVSRAMRGRMNELLRETGLSHLTGKALRELSAGPLRLRDLGERLRVVPRTVTQIADTLEAAGLVERQPHPEDRRSLNLVLTPLGRERLAEVRAIRASAFRQISSHLDEAERAEAIRLLRRMEAAIPPKTAG